MRLVIARCSVDYAGRLNAHLPLATRVLMHKGDGSLLIHSDGGSYKPLNWMSPPCRLDQLEIDDELTTAGVTEMWRVTHKKTGDTLTVRIYEVIADTTHDLGVDPGLIKDGVEADLQRLLAEQVDLIAEGATLVRREHPTAIGPVDLLIRDSEGVAIAVEVKRRGDIDGVEQLTRYLDLLGRDPILTGIRGVFAAQEIKPQARTLAQDRGIRCVTLDYEAMKGTDSGIPTLF
ncbi:endonuclease NucS [Microbacterium amylolyticum]|uniref:Endonuclease NucS n=1 Tax=Microbacterium amylolyticum TaxID=936337 RepID=A0ABS4ZHX5_9MICO|nr:endonuclease NucS [Microbacterium amylolyticum]MBP2436882.1 RecB family endonuclease NucS [Microbacterium amylolyticum]